MQSSSRRSVLCGIAGFAVLGTGRAHSADFVLKVATDVPVDHSLTIRVTEACNAINKEAAGRLEMRVFPNGQLGSSSEELSQVRSGALEIFVTSFTFSSSVVAASGMVTLGFLFDDYDRVWSSLDGDLGKFVQEEIAKSGNIVQFAKAFDNGFRHITSSRKVVMDPKDLKGFKIRVPPTPSLITLFTALGAAPTPMNFAEVYTALQTGLVDGQENPLVIAQTFKLFEVQKHCSLTGHGWDGWIPIANRRTWERLPPNLREMIAQHFNEAASRQRLDAAKTNLSLEQQLAAKGMTFHRPNVNTFRAALRQTDFYSNWKVKYGERAWGILEGAVGKLG